MQRRPEEHLRPTAWARHELQEVKTRRFPRVASEPMSLSALTWNVQWATPNSWRSSEILNRINRHVPEVICLTETHEGLLSQHGHTISSRPDYGYKVTQGRRKVILWSKEPWVQVDDLGIDSMPPGQFVSGVTQTSLGEVTVIGVCIPWFGSRTEARRRLERRAQWEDHEEYLAGLTEVLGVTSARRLIVMGDFNQTIGPSNRAPPELRLALQKAFPPSMSVATSELAFQGRRSTDHIALSEDWQVGSLGVISNVHEGRKLSDHFGIVAELSSHHFQ